MDVLLWHEDICCTIKLTSTAHPCKTGKVGMVWDVKWVWGYNWLLLEPDRAWPAHSLYTALIQQTAHRTWHTVNRTQYKANSTEDTALHKDYAQSTEHTEFWGAGSSLWSHGHDIIASLIIECRADQPLPDHNTTWARTEVRPGLIELFVTLPTRRIYFEKSINVCNWMCFVKMWSKRLQW